MIPVLIKILIVFVFVITASACGLHLGLAALAGGWAFALWQGLSIGEIGGMTLRELTDPETLLLLLLVTSIMVLSGAMKRVGAMEDFAQSVSAVTRSRNAALALTPMLIGTLPMPGGAAFSAPLVDSLDPDRALGADSLSSANYWFRHSLELWWPLFPAFILTSTLTGLSAPRLALLNFYAAPTMTILGVAFILKGGDAPRSASRTDRGAGGAKSRDLLKGFAPLILILGTYALLDVLWRVAGSGRGMDPKAGALMGRYLPILLGVAAGCLYIGPRGRKNAAFRGTLSKGTLSLVGVVAGIRVFSSLLEAGGAAEATATELEAAGIPSLIIAALLPLISGLVTGVGFGYVGLSLPIILSLFKGGAFGSMALEPIVVLVGAFGFAGMMVSPLHVCMVVSAEHFHTSISATIRRLAVPLGIFLLVAIIYVAILARAL